MSPPCTRTVRRRAAGAPHPMQRLHVELLGCLGGNEFHRRTLYRLRNRFAVAEVILLSFCIRPDVFRRHQPRIMAERLQFAAQVMCTNTSFHPDQARWHVGETFEPVSVCERDFRRERVSRGQRIGGHFWRHWPILGDRDRVIPCLRRQGRGKLRTIPRRQETRIAQDCVVGLAQLELATNRLWNPS